MLGKYIDFTHLIFDIFSINNYTKQNRSKQIIKRPSNKRDKAKLLNVEFHYIVKKHEIDNTIICEAENKWVVKAGAKLAYNCGRENNKIHTNNAQKICKEH